jgi:hypothetical protein
MRRGVGSAVGKMAGRSNVAEPVCFKVKTAQANQSGLRILDHGFEQFPRLFRAPFEHGRLGIQELDQRLLIRVQKL